VHAEHFHPTVTEQLSMLSLKALNENQAEFGFNEIEAAYPAYHIAHLPPQKAESAWR